MKSKWTAVIAFALAAAILASISLFAAPSAASEEAPADAPAQNDNLKLTKVNPEQGLVKAAENDKLILYFDNRSGGIAVEEKTSGKIFLSNPEKALEDKKASDAVKQQLMSQVELVYNVRGKEGDLSMNSYTQAMLLDQIGWAKLDNGLRISMTIGRADQRLLLPQAIGKTSFEENILAKIESEREKKQLKAFYILNSMAEVPGATEDVYTLKTSANDRDKKMLEKYVKSTGYTYEMLEADYAALGFNPDDMAFPSFGMNIDYILEGDSLSVSLNVDEMTYDADKFNLVSLSLLNYFGAGETGEQGYIFLPDGSGTLIGFNNDGTKRTLMTTGKVYGNDYALSMYERGSFKQDFRYPVFGIIREDSAIMAVIDDGDAVADINGMLGNINHSYNTAYASFTIKNKDKFIEENAFEQAPWIVYEKKPYSGKINIRYYFLAGEDADYVGMARTYQKHLIETGVLKKAATEEDIPFYFETLGSIDMIVRRLGIPMSTQVPITTFEQAEDMLKQLSQEGVSNIKLRYKGWYNGGYWYTAPTRMKTERVLGGSKGLAELVKNAAAQGIEVYPDVDFVFVPRPSLFDGFNPGRDSIRNLFQKTAYLPELDLPSLSYDNTKWIISPDRIPGYYDKFAKSLDKLNIQSVSLSTMGQSLSSNFKNNKQINRQGAKDYMTGVLNKASQNYDSVLTDFGNAYAYSYADHLLNLPEEDSSFMISDKQVPFIQIALHGYIPYAGQPINLANEVGPAVLKAVEYGSGAYFVMNYGSNSILKKAGVYDVTSSMHFADWKDDAADIYTRMNAALKDVQDQSIIDHEEIAGNVFKTTYENGKSIIVNYNKQSVEADGLTIAPLDFAVSQN